MSCLRTSSEATTGRLAKFSGQTRMVSSATASGPIPSPASAWRSASTYTADWIAAAATLSLSPRPSMIANDLISMTRNRPLTWKAIRSGSR